MPLYWPQHERGELFGKEALQNAISGVLDVDAAAMVVAAMDPETVMAIAPGLDPCSTPDERVEFLATQHLQSIRDGFPLSFEAAEVTVKALGEIIIAKAKEEMEKNRAILARRYGFRKEKHTEISNSIRSGVDNSNYNRQYEKKLMEELETLDNQIKAINSALETEIEIPKNVVDFGPSEQDEQEQAEAQDREEQNLEEETSKLPVATQIKLTKSEFSGKTTFSIESIEIAGSPPSPISGSMGAHTTAWIVQTDRIQRALLRQTLEGALDIMNNLLLPEAFQLEETLIEADPPTALKQADLMEEAKKNVLARKLKKLEEYGSPSELAFTLQQYINELLVYN